MVTEDDQIVSDLRDAIRDGRSGLRYVPRLLGLVLERGAWRRRVDEHGEPYEFDTFDQFAAAAPMAGLGADPDLIDRIVGTTDTDLMTALREARKTTPGRKAKGVKPLDSNGVKQGEDSSYTAGRLRPAEREAVKRGEKTLHSAARAAGIRKPRILVRLDDAESAARTLRRHMAPEQLSTLARLLLDA